MCIYMRIYIHIFPMIFIHLHFPWPYLPIVRGRSPPPSTSHAVEAMLPHLDAPTC